jgi:predicted DNA-binding protein with PD1-like motif
MKTYCLRLHPNVDLKPCLKAFAKTHQLQAGIILTAIGSLHQATLRFANQPETTHLTGPFEIISLAGTVSCHGLHIHGAIADATGSMYGGHLMDGCLIRTTAEIAIADLPNLEFHRELDDQTGYAELSVKQTFKGNVL